MKTIVLDPGHGGHTTIGGSSPNNATSASNVKEKDICLDLAKRVKGKIDALNRESNANITVILTRTTDINLSLSDRASVASDNSADIYLSIHCNGADGRARGTECWIDRKYMQAKKEFGPGSISSRPGPGKPSSGLRNINVDKDADFAKTMVDAVHSAFSKFDSGSKIRSSTYTRRSHGESYKPPKGVKMKGLGTLRDAKLGTLDNGCRAALLEIEFIDHPAVDKLLNGGQANVVRKGIADAIANGILKSL